MIPVLETERLVMRKWRESDLESYAAQRSDPELMRYIGKPLTAQEVRDDFHREVNQWQTLGYGCFIATLAGTGVPVGFAGLWHPEDLDEPELCWSLFPGHFGKGYATEAADAALVWAAKELGLPPLMSFIHPDNAPSHAVALRLGAERQADTTFRGAPRCFYRHRRVDQ